jgi:hypothetical protein
VNWPGWLGSDLLELVVDLAALRVRCPGDELPATPLSHRPSPRPGGSGRSSWRFRPTVVGGDSNIRSQLRHRVLTASRTERQRRENDRCGQGHHERAPQDRAPETARGGGHGGPHHSRGDQPQQRPPAAHPGHDEGFDPAVDGDADPVAHRRRIGAAPIRARATGDPRNRHARSCCTTRPWPYLDSGPPVWNFTKYLVGSDVRRLARWPTKVPLEDPQIIEALEAALRAG